jgi:hypothetical protein
MPNDQLSDNDLRELLGACGQATPGPWHAPGLGEVHCDHDNDVHVHLDGKPLLDHDGEPVSEICDSATEINANFIARFDPTTCAALVKEVIRLRTVINKTLDDNGHLADGEVCTLIDLKRAIGRKD